ncbi:response regulator transcription factor [Streptomyces rhizosphaerihabitans]|uniref:response regulator transcription factor n=1 Tax=Streptomyces rhizosphaerihabitans TaxID=1266770 RepID=UPI0021BDFD7F|nr:response regulator transcription factor [Streptomyces rhizosphaerihabitans]MCT9008520.1 response regulator transcription factor [Streptomyces rhizosphaerihabitans]
MTDDPGKKRAVVADDLPLIRCGLRIVAERCGFGIVTEVESIPELRCSFAAAPPALLIAGTNLLGADLIAEIPGALRRIPELRIVVAGSQGDVSAAQSAIRAGAHGYIHKGSRIGELHSAVRAVLAGGMYIDPQLVGQLLYDDPVEPVAGLSRRELDVLEMISNGLTNRQIASRLHIGVRTVEECRAVIRRKTGLNDRSELTAFARRVTGSMVSRGHGSPAVHRAGALGRRG